MTYDMDSATYEHLYRWMANNAPIGASIIDETDAVVTYLQALTDDEAGYYLRESWDIAYRDAQKQREYDREIGAGLETAGARA